MSFDTIAVSPHLHPELEDLRGQFREARADALSLTAGLTEAQMHWRPGPDRWSIADCLEHLSLTAGKLLPRLDRAITEAQRRRDPAAPVAESFRRGLFGGWLVRRMEPPVRYRFRAPRSYTPPQDGGKVSARETLERYDATQEALMQRVRRSQGLDLGAIKMASPVTRLLRLSLFHWFAFLAAHERRHLWQARQVTREGGFPVAG